MKDPFTTFENEFRAVKTEMERKYGKEGWRVRVYRFPEDSSVEGVGIQLSKEHWFNEEGLGIHFETWVTEKEIQKKTLKFVMHVLHQEFFPGTEKKPYLFIFPFVENEVVIGYVADWKGFKMGRVHPIKGQKRFKESTEEVILSEFTTFRGLGDEVDATLRDALS